MIIRRDGFIHLTDLNYKHKRLMNLQFGPCDRDDNEACYDGIHAWQCHPQNSEVVGHHLQMTQILQILQILVGILQILVQILQIWWQQQC